MATKASVFFDRLKDKKIAIVGIGLSHIDMIKMFAEKGLDIIVYDKRTAEELGELYTEFTKLGICLELGSRYLSKLGGEEIIFRTPGMDYFTPELNMARYAGTAVTTELEVFFDLCPCKTIGVTGTDGKTTTATMIAKLLTAQGKKVHLGGAPGRGLLPKIDKIHPKDYVVVELSSFQLVSMRQSPNTSVITNINPTHLGVHKNMEAYIEAKKNIYRHQNGFARTVINGDNGVTQKMVSEVRGKLCQFSQNTAVQRGAWVNNNGVMWYAENDSQTRIMDVKDMKLSGKHNLQNFLAAVSAVWGTVTKETVIKVAKEFEDMEHHTKLVRELEGVSYYNDSVATRETHAITSFAKFEDKLVAIMGGDGYECSFELLAPKVLNHVKTLIVMGDSGKSIEENVTSLPEYKKEELTILRAKTLEEAVFLAQANAVAGDIVLFSPACESMYRYSNFSIRGNHFIDTVKGLK